MDTDTPVRASKQHRIGRSSPVWGRRITGEGVGKAAAWVAAGCSWGLMGATGAGVGVAIGDRGGR